MTRAEMHSEFKFLMDKADSSAAPIFLDTEIDRLLNIAVEKFVSKRAFGNNPRRTGFEEDQKRRDDLRNLIKQADIGLDAYSSIEGSELPGEPLYSNKPNSAFITLPSDYRHTINEECTLKGGKRVGVKPITHDRYNKIIDDPFHSPDGNVIYRLDAGEDKFELLYAQGQDISKYLLRYIKNPDVIGASNGAGSEEVKGCNLANHTHREIVRMAVVDALETVEQPRYQSSKIELNEIE